MKRELDKATGRVTFNEGPHTYENEEGQRYLSVTQLIDKFKNKFNSREAAEAASIGKNPRYVGRSVEDIMAEWDKAGSDARTGGTKFHKKKEDTHIKQSYSITEKVDSSFIPNPARIIPQEDEGVMTDYTELPDGIYSELILWSHRWKLAGIADKVIIDGDFFDIEDYKTNKEIRRTSYWDPKTRKNKMLQFPLDDLMDCHLTHYELQLSIYAYMMEELSGKKVRNLTILHHPTQPDGSVREREERISCKNRRHDILMMFNMWGGFAPPSFLPDIQPELKKDDPYADL